MAPTSEQAAAVEAQRVRDAVRELGFAIRYYRGEVFREWLASVFTVGHGHGSELVHALGSPRSDRPGLTDNVYAADKFLDGATAAGWIVRSAVRPTAEQRFFDVEGNLRGKGPKYPRFYFYTLNPWAVDALEFLRAGVAHRAEAA